MRVLDFVILFKRRIEATVGSTLNFYSDYCFDRQGVILFELGVWGLWHINLCRLLNAESIFIQIIPYNLNNSD